MTEPRTSREKPIAELRSELLREGWPAEDADWLSRNLDQSLCQNCGKSRTMHGSILRNPPKEEWCPDSDFTTVFTPLNTHRSKRPSTAFECCACHKSVQAVTLPEGWCETGESTSGQLAQWCQEHWPKGKLR